MKLSTITLLLAVSSALTNHAISNPAQAGGHWQQLVQHNGDAELAYFGTRVCSIGDANGDGKDDYLITSPASEVSATPEAGKVSVYSGATHDVLFQYFGGANNLHFATSVAGAGDVNNDGFDDFILGNWHAKVGNYENAGRFEVYSGKDGTELYSFQGRFSNHRMGRDVAGAGDVNNDGYDDFIVGEHGRTRVYSGFNGSTIAYYCPGTDGGYGKAVDGVGDIDKDGWDDFAVGDPTSDSWSSSNNGLVRTYSGRTGSYIHTFYGDPADQRLGTDVSAAGDVNADGYPDVIFATKHGAEIYSGLDFNLIRAHKDFNWISKSDFTVSDAGDINQDGHDDYWVGTPPDSTTKNASVTCYSGATGLKIFQFDSQPNKGTRMSHAAGGDINGDGYDDIMIGTSGYTAHGSNQNTGMARILAFDPCLEAGIDSISASKGANVIFSLNFPPEAGGQEYRMLMSQNGEGPTHFGIAIPLTRDRMLLDSFHGNYAVNSHYNMHGTLDANGHTMASFAFPAKMPSAMIGECFWFAAITGPNQSQPTISSVAVMVEILP